MLRKTAVNNLFLYANVCRCEFLLQRKGPDFVHRMVSMFPNLPRPLLRGPFDDPPREGVRFILSGSTSGRAPTPPPEIVDPQVLYSLCCVTPQNVHLLYVMVRLNRC